MTRKAGSIILDRLRDRILLGRYFGCWEPGDRLPSVRELARLEDVDRKTAAAAYRRLEREGLVRVEARSGVYLRARASADGGDPLQRLHRQWLEQALAAAAQLGLGSETVARMLQAVVAVESRRIPVVDGDREHATLVAREIAARTGLECTACRPDDLPGLSGALRDAPFVVATPAASVRLRPAQRSLPVIQAVLAPALLDGVRRLAGGGPVTVVVGTQGLADELRRAIRHGLCGPADRVRVLRPSAPSELSNGSNGSNGGRPPPRVVLWPGAPSWAAEHVGENGTRHHSLLADSTVGEVRRQVARAAFEAVSRSSVA